MCLYIVFNQPFDIQQFLIDLSKSMKKETAIILFYFLYFFWLFAVTYLLFNILILNYFTVFVALFYLIFLREKGDIVWFIFASFIPILFSFFTFSGWQVNFYADNLRFFPPWLALAWGTTIVALRKLYFVINK
jgi:hypothetical protein